MGIIKNIAAVGRTKGHFAAFKNSLLLDFFIIFPLFRGISGGGNRGEYAKEKSGRKETRTAFGQPYYNGAGKTRKSAERDGKKRGFFTSDEFCPRLPVIFLKTPSEFYVKLNYNVLFVTAQVQSFFAPVFILLNVVELFCLHTAWVTFPF